MRRSLVALAGGLACLGRAEAETLAHQGRLLDALGTPVNGVHETAFVVTDGVQTWTEQLSVAFDDGYYAVLLGDDAANSLPGDLFASDSLTLSMDINGLISTTMPVHPVPRSVYATSAASAEQAGFATSAGHATTADTATTATNVSGGTASVTDLDVAGEASVSGNLSTTGYLSGQAGLYAGGSGRRAIAYASSAVDPITYTDGQWLTIWNPGDSGTFILSVAFDSVGEGGQIWNYRAGGFVSVGQTAHNNGNRTDALDFNWSAHATNGRTVEFRYLMPCCQAPGAVQMRVTGESLTSPMPLYTNWVRLF